MEKSTDYIKSAEDAAACFTGTGIKPLDVAALSEAEEKNYEPLNYNAGLSEFWHKNRSSSEASSLANLLKALRKVSGYIGQNVGIIEYIGMSAGGNSSVIIDPSLVMGKYPIPFYKVDNAVGFIVHESIHRVEWSEHVWRTLEPEFKKMGGLERIAFQKVVYAGEDLYVDMMADKTVFGEYVKIAKDGPFARAKPVFPSNLLTLDEIIHIFRFFGKDYKSYKKLPVLYEKPLSILNRLNSLLEEKIFSKTAGVTEKCKKRASVYFEIWQQLRDHVEPFKILNKQLLWYPSSIEGSEEKESVKKKKTVKCSLPLNLVHEIETNIAAGSVNITPIIYNIVGYDNKDVVAMSRWNFKIPAHPIIDKKLVSRLKSIFINYAKRKKVINRGLLGGRVDPRRLYRAPVSGRCFKQIDNLPDMNWSVTLLMDASGSMQGNKWRMVENTIGNIYLALRGSQIRLQAYAYFEMDRVCMISKLISGGKLLSVPPSGQTASGQAIIAAAYFKPKEASRNILIHVTDGESNFGCDVQCGIDYCHREKVNLVTLGCGYKDKKEMLKQYGKSIQFIDSYGQLPKALEHLFKWTFLYGIKSKNREDDYYNKIKSEVNESAS